MIHKSTNGLPLCGQASATDCLVEGELIFLTRSDACAQCLATYKKCLELAQAKATHLKLKGAPKPLCESNGPFVEVEAEVRDPLKRYIDRAKMPCNDCLAHLYVARMKFWNAGGVGNIIDFVARTKHWLKVATPVETCPVLPKETAITSASIELHASRNFHPQSYCGRTDVEMVHQDGLKPEAAKRGIKACEECVARTTVHVRVHGGGYSACGATKGAVAMEAASLLNGSRSCPDCVKTMTLHSDTGCVDCLDKSNQQLILGERAPAGEDLKTVARHRKMIPCAKCNAFDEEMQGWDKTRDKILEDHLNAERKTSGQAFRKAMREGTEPHSALQAEAKKWAQPSDTVPAWVHKDESLSKLKAINDSKWLEVKLTHADFDGRTFCGLPTNTVNALPYARRKRLARITNYCRICYAEVHATKSVAVRLAVAALVAGYASLATLVFYGL